MWCLYIFSIVVFILLPKPQTRFKQVSREIDYGILNSLIEKNSITDLSINIYQNEQVISTWNVNGTDWNSYHNEIILELDQDKYLVISYRAAFSSMFYEFIVPVFTFPYGFQWKNEAEIGVELYDDLYKIPGKKTLLGKASSYSIMEYLDIYIWRYLETHPVFQPIRVIEENDSPFFLRSSFCHDFVDYSVHNYFNFSNTMIDRDFINVYSDRIVRVGKLDVFDIVGFYIELYWYALYHVKDDFFNIYRWLINKEYVYILHNQKYQKVYLKKPYTDYCYSNYYNTYQTCVLNDHVLSDELKN